MAERLSETAEWCSFARYHSARNPSLGPPTVSDVHRQLDTSAACTITRGQVIAVDGNSLRRSQDCAAGRLRVGLQPVRVGEDAKGPALARTIVPLLLARVSLFGIKRHPVLAASNHIVGSVFTLPAAVATIYDHVVAGHEIGGL